MSYPEIGVFHNFTQVIVWGYPLSSDVYSYIHGAWAKAFQHLGIRVHWFHDGYFPSDFDYTNTCFITDGYVDNNIPIESSSIYFVHRARSPQKYVSKGARLLDIRYNIAELHDETYDYSLPASAIHLSKDTLYESVSDDSAVAAKQNQSVSPVRYEAVYMYCKTDLLLYEPEIHTYIQRIRDLARALTMKSIPITMVTAIYDIGRAAVDGRGMLEYKEWLLKTLKAVKDPFCLYMDRRLGWKTHILEARQEIGPIKIIETDISEISMWKYKDKINSILNNPQFKAQQKHPRDITNLLDGYCMIQYSKFGFLEDTIQQNPFNSEYFSWIDAGLSRFIDISRIHRFNPSSCCGDFFYIQGNQPLTNLSIITYDNYIGTNTCILRGGLWVMQRGSFKYVRDEVMRIFETEMLEKNRIDNEQIAIGLSYKNIPDIFNIKITRHCRWGPVSIFEELFTPIR